MCHRLHYFLLVAEPLRGSCLCSHDILTVLVCVLPVSRGDGGADFVFPHHPLCRTAHTAAVWPP